MSVFDFLKQRGHSCDSPPSQFDIQFACFLAFGCGFFIPLTSRRERVQEGMIWEQAAKRENWLDEC